MTAVVGCSLTTPLEEFQGEQGGSNASAGTGGATAGGGNTGGSMPLPQGYAAEVLADMPVAYWRLGESRGTQAFDRSTMGLDAVYLGPVALGELGSLTGDADTAVTLADTAHILVGHVLDFPAQANFTLEAWVKPAVQLTQFSFFNVIAKIDYDNVAGLHYGYQLVVSGGGVRVRRQTLEFVSEALGPVVGPGVFKHLVGT